MQLINYFPDINQLQLPKAIAKRAIELFIEPFDTQAEAQFYWQSGQTQLLILTKSNDVDMLSTLLSPALCQQVDDAINNPEFVEALPDEYALSLTIHSADGNGLYVIRPLDIDIEFINQTPAQS
ncbi:MULTISPECIES: hypothetical protein [unclassified Colwellia]|uniref:hypothetical protein n=1 Tax=unclassified Colwellia TaxID=196834 RepID=UPI0015F3FF69|nr:MULTISPECIES: hypothetical protein [unclassified Colwellia]MBA6353409.1 hypothetical protein [Colwellia sp. BRX9-1]MBA6358099.1 hypothetical protein [Colwellia sp. BRX8-3]MBA6359768.1 hypothetical protein [Colwellia sp. BRX8-6]MBA6368288.1 hypothetical protein [Colwellia sp. BRX8-5]MBA6377332.1 hypothetical protein [Colwellia sp. BRX8-2]